MPSAFQRARTARLLLSIIALCFAIPASAPAQSQTVTFTALGKDKRFVSTLRKEDIRILDEGTPQEIIKFERQTDSLLSVVIMFDASFSQLRTLPIAKRAANAFLDSIIHPGKDLTAVMSFASEATLEQGLTLDVERVRRRIERIRPEDELSVSLSGPTANPQNQTMGSSTLYDAVWLASSDVLGQDNGSMRRAIILISDGEDTASTKKMSDAIEQAIRANVTIFAIGAGDTDYGGIARETLRKMTERTGGRAFFPKKISGLPAILTEIEQELRSQYLITFSPVNSKREGKIHKIKIEVANAELRKQDLRLSYQQGYFR